MNLIALLADAIVEHHGLIIGLAVLAAVMFVNQLIWRRRWSSYLTREQYLAAHPGCATVHGILCDACGRKALSGPVVGAGRIYRCGWCDTELYRVDLRQTGLTEGARSSL